MQDTVVVSDSHEIPNCHLFSLKVRVQKPPSLHLPPKKQQQQKKTDYTHSGIHLIYYFNRKYIRGLKIVLSKYIDYFNKMLVYKKFLLCLRECDIRCNTKWVYVTKYCNRVCLDIGNASIEWELYEKHIRDVLYQFLPCGCLCLNWFYWHFLL